MTSPSSSIFDPTADAGPVGRILDAAKRHIFASGLSAFTMDGLAGELGMSKKTIYAHFPGKEAIAMAIIDGLGRFVQGRLEAIVSDRSLNCTEKLVAAINVIGTVLSKVSPAMLADFRRNTPRAYAKLDDMRRRNIPRFFGQLVRDGIAEGAIRPDVDPEFAAEFWFQVIRGLIDPDVLERLQVTPRQALERAVGLYFQGLLTPGGLDQYRLHVETSKRASAI
ncbi:bacterial regulatory protein, tetR family [mine drainage metagenome]|uniref:Bacterial regulatory protein, tetR family n=1 Tax=mine drainage metagenome TaxID=410659 RepID=A0A1J5SXV2_9ZZZZ